MIHIKILQNLNNRIIKEKDTTDFNEGVQSVMRLIDSDNMRTLIDNSILQVLVEHINFQRDNYLLTAQTYAETLCKYPQKNPKMMQELITTSTESLELLDTLLRDITDSLHT